MAGRRRDVRSRRASSVKGGDRTRTRDTDLHRRRRAPWREDAPFVAWIIGCGLMGGSIARALRRRWPAVTVVGVDQSSVLQRARDEGVIDDALPRRTWMQRLVQEPPELVILATPVDAVLQTLDALAGTRNPNPAPLVVDLGSVKGPVVQRADEVGCPRFVGGHPMAGRAEGGLSSATADLFDARPFVLCPASATSRQDVADTKSLVRGLGATPVVCSADEHDDAVALVSHLPHLVAWALMETLGERSEAHRDSRLAERLAAGSWRDATRVAMADPKIWRPILEHSREPAARSLDTLIDVLQRLREGLCDPSVDVLQPGPTGVDAAKLGRQRRRQARKLPP